MYSNSFVGAPISFSRPTPLVQYVGQQSFPTRYQNNIVPLQQFSVVANQPLQIIPQTIRQAPPPQIYSSRVSVVPPISSQPVPLQVKGVLQPQQLVQTQNIPPNIQPIQLVQSQIIASPSSPRLTSQAPLEKPVVIINSDMAKRLQFQSQDQEQEPIIDNTDKELAYSLEAKLERLLKIETALNSTISQKVSSVNSKEFLTQQLKEQREKLQEIMRIQSIRQGELQGSIQRTRQDLDQMISIQTEGEEEIERLKALLEEKNRIINKWKARGSEADKLGSDLSLLQQQFNQLQSQNQVLRNNIKLDPSYNYLII